MELKTILQSNFPEAELLCREDRIILIRLQRLPCHYLCYVSTSRVLTAWMVKVVHARCACTCGGCRERGQGNGSHPGPYHLVMTFCYVSLLPCTQVYKVKSYTYTTLHFVNIITKGISSAMEFFLILHSNGYRSHMLL